MPVEDDIQTLLWKVCPLYEHIGLSVELARDGHYRCRLPLTPANTNHLDTIHAALQWAVAEVLGGLVVLSIFRPAQFSKLYAAVTAARIDFLKPARGALLAETTLAAEEHDRIRAQVDGGDEARFELDVTLRLETGTSVATLNGQYIVRPRRGA